MSGRRLSVLVTGAASTVGRHLVHRLYHDPRVSFVFGVGRQETTPAFADYDERRFVYYRLNILRQRELRNLLNSEPFRRAGVEAVVHLEFVNRSRGGGAQAHRLNVEGTRRLLDACTESRQIRKFVCKSSDVVYKLGPQAPVYLNENAELNFDSEADPWVQDRVNADMICRTKMDASGLKVIVLRFAPIIGGNPGTRLNAFFDEPIQFRAMGFDPLINVVHVSDVVQALTLALFQPVKGVFNIAGGDVAPVSSFAAVTGALVLPIPSQLLLPANWLLGKMGSRYYYPVDRDRMRYGGALDVSKARKVLSFVPHRFLAADGRHIDATPVGSAQTREDPSHGLKG